MLAVSNTSPISNLAIVGGERLGELRRVGDGANVMFLDATLMPLIPRRFAPRRLEKWDCHQEDQETWMEPEKACQIWILA